MNYREKKKEAIRLERIAYLEIPSCARPARRALDKYLACKYGCGLPNRMAKNLECPGQAVCDLLYENYADWAEAREEAGDGEK